MTDEQVRRCFAQARVARLATADAGTVSDPRKAR